MACPAETTYSEVNIHHNQIRGLSRPGDRHPDPIPQSLYRAQVSSVNQECGIHVQRAAASHTELLRLPSGGELVRL